MHRPMHRPYASSLCIGMPGECSRWPAENGVIEWSRANDEEWLDLNRRTIRPSADKPVALWKSNGLRRNETIPRDSAPFDGKATIGLHEGQLDWMQVWAPIEPADRARLSQAASLRSLEFDYDCPATDEHLRQIPVLPKNLRRLSVRSEAITAVGLGIEYLNLCQADLSDDGFAMLARSPYVTNLKTCVIGTDEVSSTAIQILLESPSLPNRLQFEVSLNNANSQQRSGWRTRFGPQIDRWA